MDTKDVKEAVDLIRQKLPDQAEFEKLTEFVRLHEDVTSIYRHDSLRLIEPLRSVLSRQDSPKSKGEQAVRQFRDLMGSCASHDKTDEEMQHHLESINKCNADLDNLINTFATLELVKNLSRHLGPGGTSSGTMEQLMDHIAPWMDGKYPLWLSGLPGCGKTYIATKLVGALSTAIPKSGYACVHVNFSGLDPTERGAKNLLHKALLGLLEQHPKDDERDELLNRAKEDPSSATTERVIEVVKQFKCVYFIIDELNVCKERGQVLEVLASLMKLGRKEESGCNRRVNVLIASRNTQDGDASMKGLAEDTKLILMEDQAKGTRDDHATRQIVPQT